MRTYLRYYATEKKHSEVRHFPTYNATAEYSSGFALDSRFSTLEETANRLVKEIKKQGEKIPEKMKNGPTRHDIIQHGYLREKARPLTAEEEQRFLQLLGLR